MNYELLRNAPVTVEATQNQSKEYQAVVVVNEKYQHTFPATSRVSKSLETTTPKEIEKRLSGGQFFFVNDDLVDFRDNQYTGFVHDDKSIASLVSTLGINEGSSRSKLHRNLQTSKYVLGTKWSDHGIQVKGYNDGGQFKSELHYGWNPFTRHVNSAFMLYRLVCQNGMMGLTSFLNTKIPLVNRWEEHLEIANRQIQNKVDNKVSHRLSQMGNERASVQELLLLNEHIQHRMKESHDKGNDQERNRLRNIMNIVHPVVHLSDVYKDSVFQDRHLAAQVPGHLTTFDTYNIATEVRTHTEAAPSSSDHALDKFANVLLFDRKDLTRRVDSTTRKSSFSDPDTAFFGEVA